MDILWIFNGYLWLFLDILWIFYGNLQDINGFIVCPEEHELITLEYN